jgi:hypothetical protein
MRMDRHRTVAVTHITVYRHPVITVLHLLVVTIRLRSTGLMNHIVVEPVIGGHHHLMKAIHIPVLTLKDICRHLLEFLEDRCPHHSTVHPVHSRL